MVRATGVRMDRLRDQDAGAGRPAGVGVGCGDRYHRLTYHSDLIQYYLVYRRVAAPDSLKSEKKSDHDSDPLDLTREPRHATGVGTACQKSDSGV